MTPSPQPSHPDPSAHPKSTGADTPTGLKVIVGARATPSPWRRRFKKFACLVILVNIWVILAHVVMMQVTLQTAIAPAQSGFASIQSLFQPAIAALTPDSTEETAAPKLQFGHLPYAEAERRRLIVVGSYSQDGEQRFERLDRVAGLALMKMLDAARVDGVWIVPVSAFRDVDRQASLFQSQVDYQGSAAAAAKTVAPPGHSEHHTGFAVDLANGLAPTLDINPAFGESAAFQWLDRHAQEFGFELSFPKNNDQGVNYEPWHWRFVASYEAEKTFASARIPSIGHR